MPETFVISPAAVVSPPVAGSATRFPIQRVFCVGRNFADHAREMGNDPDREPPFFFMKPASAVAEAAGAIAYPPLTSELHHEVELVVAIGQGGANIAVGQAPKHIWGYAIGVDLTRRDLQSQAKKMGRPWEWGKSFDAAAPCGPVFPASAFTQPASGHLWLDVNGQRRQEGKLEQMIWQVPEVIALISQSMRLLPGDLIFTGTPAGVGALARGDRVTAGVEGLGGVDFAISLISGMRLSDLL